MFLSLTEVTTQHAAQAHCLTRCECVALTIFLTFLSTLLLVFLSLYCGGCMAFEEVYPPDPEVLEFEHESTEQWDRMKSEVIPERRFTSIFPAEAIGVVSAVQERSRPGDGGYSEKNRGNANAAGRETRAEGEWAHDFLKVEQGGAAEQDHQVMYDEEGGYYDADGGYTDAAGNYYDHEGNLLYPAGTY
eukprot:g17858.t1